MLGIKIVQKGDRFKVVEDYAWRGYTIPSGFVSDLDSVPRIPIIYGVFKLRTISGAIIHDFLYFSKVDRKLSDKLFLDAMKEEGVTPFYRYSIYYAVRLFGWIKY